MFFSCANVFPPPPSYPPPLGWANKGASGYPTGAPPSPGLSAMSTSDAAVHAFAVVLQVVGAAGVGSALSFPSPIAPSGRVSALLMIHLLFTWRVAGGADLPPICEEVDRVKWCMWVLATLNRTLLRELPSFWRVFGGKVHFSASLSILVFVKNVSLLNPSMDPACSGVGVTPWITHPKRPPRPPPPKALYQRPLGASNPFQIAHNQQTVLAWNPKLPTIMKVMSHWRTALMQSTLNRVNPSRATTHLQDMTVAWNLQHKSTNLIKFMRTSG